jgi:hypothetical protein
MWVTGNIIMPRNTAETDWRFGRMCRLHLQAKILAPSSNEQHASRKVWLSAWLTLLSCRWRQYGLLKRRCARTKLYGVTFQKIIVFVVTDLGISYTTYFQHGHAIMYIYQCNSPQIQFLKLLQAWELPAWSQCSRGSLQFTTGDK